KLAPLLLAAAIFVILGRLRLRCTAAFIPCESELFMAADPPVRIKAFQHELGSGDALRIIRSRPNPKRRILIEQALNALQLLQRNTRWHRVIELQRAT